MIKFSKYLQGGEELWYSLYRHPASWTVPGLSGALLILLAFFLLWPLFQYGGWGTMGFALLLSSGGYISLRAHRLWRGNFILVTNRRIVDVARAGWFTESVSQLYYNEIQDISWSKKGLGATLWGYGTVQLVGASGSTRLMFTYIKDPNQVAALLTAVRAKTATSPTTNQSSKSKLSTADHKKTLINQVFNHRPK